MKDFNREEWLKTLKKGDKVANKERYGWEKYEYYARGKSWPFRE